LSYGGDRLLYYGRLVITTFNGSCDACHTVTVIVTQFELRVEQGCVRVVEGGGFGARVDCPLCGLPLSGAIVRTCSSVALLGLLRMANGS